MIDACTYLFERALELSITPYLSSLNATLSFAGPAQLWRGRPAHRKALPFNKALGAGLLEPRRPGPALETERSQSTELAPEPKGSALSEQGAISWIGL